MKLLLFSTNYYFRTLLGLGDPREIRRRAETISGWKHPQYRQPISVLSLRDYQIANYLVYDIMTEN
jgi:hypothetical protein